MTNRAATLLGLGLYSISAQAFESTNLQLLYSNQFDGDAFIYDTVDGHKTTLTLEHFRTWQYGDFYAFVDIMEGEKFDGTRREVYAEIAPRLSLSKLMQRDFTDGAVKDLYVATQLNSGNDYTAYLFGAGSDFEVVGLNYLSLNLYHKHDNINSSDTYQVTVAYQTRTFYDFHLEGFVDWTSRDLNTQNQILYDLGSHLSSRPSLFGGVEWVHYRYEDQGAEASTNAIQMMAKYRF